MTPGQVTSFPWTILNTKPTLTTPSLYVAQPNQAVVLLIPSTDANLDALAFTVSAVRLGSGAPLMLTIAPGPGGAVITGTMPRVSGLALYRVTVTSSDGHEGPAEPPVTRTFTWIVSGFGRAR